MRRITLILLMFVFCDLLIAQEKTLLYSHFSFNGLAINPAYAGRHEMLSVSLSHRSQWIGFDGAPSYNIAGIHTPLKNTAMGLGLLVMNESIGLRKYTGIYFNYAHRMALGNGKLALGLKGGMGTGRMETVDLGDDIVFADNEISYLLPNFGVGAYYYTQRYFVGLSVPLLLGYRTDKTGKVTAYHDFSNYAYYLNAGIRLRLAPDWQLEPATLLEYEKGGGLIADACIGVFFRDILHAGLTCRFKQAVIILADFKITNQLRIGIAYDYGTGHLSSYYRSSFEAGIEYNFGYKIKAANPTIF